ncbi:MAG: acyl-CoA desaturase [Bacteroidia bacterium]|nr:acyl-CoA desaturase [Bacteroidia bacterium]
MCIDSRSEDHYTIRYSGKQEYFFKLIRERIDLYFEKSKKSQYADFRMIGKGIFQFTTLVVLYFLMISDYFTGWTLFFIQILFYFFIFLVAVGIAHDASHNACSKKKWINKLLRKVFDLIGINSYLWELNHIKSHHSVPNVPRLDSAIDSFVLFRLHPRAKYYSFHRFQHLYIFFLYGFSTLFKIFFLDIYSYSRNRIGFIKTEQHTGKELLWLICTKVFVLTYSLIIPAFLLSVPFWQFFLGFLCGNFLTGITLGIIFQVTHITEKTCWPEPDENGVLNNSFANHVLETTSDFSTNNKLITWIAGGLNHHVAHHLFPNISQIHLPVITKIIESIAVEYGVSYKKHDSVYEALKSHLITLKQLGRSEDFTGEVSIIQN